MRPAFVFALALLAFAEGKKPTVEEKIREDPELSQFYTLLERSKSINSSLQYRQLTIFAPTNEAFQRYTGPADESLLLYHITNVAVMLDQVGRVINSELDGNPPLWVTKHKSAHHDEIFINTAKILTHRSNYAATNQYNKRQVLHVIDDVLIPVTPASATSSSSGAIFNPDAGQFLFHSENFDTQTHRVRSFRQRVSKLKKQDIFSNEGRHTFFIPVDEGFKPQPRPELIDERVVDGHVIPNHVLFTRATPDDHPFATLAFSDNLKVTISFAKTDDGKTYIKSNTLNNDTKHSTGVVLADIVKGNIPLRNGVLHLIQRPLIIVDTSVTQFLEEKEDGPLYKFYEVIMDMGGDFMQKLTRMQNLTLFAPSNEAWKDPNLDNIIRDKQRLREILNLHVVEGRLPLNTFMTHNMPKVPTLAGKKHLYFNVVNVGNNQTLTVEGEGVNATVIQPNIAATNGIVHIINRVLGVPHTTVLEKLRSDPTLNETYFLGKKRSFNSELNNTSHRYTYFVPRNEAWGKFQVEYPSAYKKLFMDDFSYHTRQILERHLVVSDISYSMDHIKLLANDTDGLVLPTLRDTLRLRIREESNGYFIEWQNKWIHVYRPDVKCTNGIIHVINFPFLKESDIYVTGGATTIAQTFTVLLISHLIKMLIC